MAKDEVERDEKTIAVPLRRLLTGVPRTKRAPASIPRVKRYVLRHVKPEWRDAIWDDAKGVHRVWIDDFLNKTIWSRGREHIAGPREWVEGAEGSRARLSRRTTSRYGSVLKVKALFVEEPRDGGDPRLEVYLYGYGDLEKEKEAEEGEEKKTGEEEEKQEGEADEEEGEEEEDEEPAAQEPAPEPVKAPESPTKPASTSAAAKGAKTPKGAAKSESKKPAAKPKKEGGD